MPVNRFFLPQQFVQHQEVSLSDREFHHLVNVLRSAIGDEVELVNGKGELAVGQITEIKKKHAQILIQTLHVAPQPHKPLILAQALPRMNRLEFIVEKGTELGMTHLWLFSGDRGEKSTVRETKLEHLQNIAIAAMKQCGRLFLPIITLQPSIPSPEGFLAFFGDLDPAADYPPNNVTTPFNGVVCYIGPESGFSQQETDKLKEWGVKGVKLHTNILRTDTAAIAAMLFFSRLIQNESLDKK